MAYWERTEEKQGYVVETHQRTLYIAGRRLLRSKTDILVPQAWQRAFTTTSTVLTYTFLGRVMLNDGCPRLRGDGSKSLIERNWQVEALPTCSHRWPKNTDMNRM